MQDDQYLLIREDGIDQNFDQIYIVYHGRSYVCNQYAGYTECAILSVVC